MTWNVDRRKMYAHIYFDLDQNQLGLAVYAIGKLPGFSGALSDDLKNETGSSKAYDLFLKTLEKENITKEELQLGKAFSLSDIEDKLNRLDILGKLHAKDPQAQVVVDIDDPMFWAQFKISQLPKDKQAQYKSYSDDQKRELGEQIKKTESGALLENISSPEQLQEAMQKIYVSVARSINPNLGPKEYASSKSSPPTFLVSKEHNFAYYPGFRGAQYMSKIPKALDYVHPQQEKDTSMKWYEIILPDTKQFTGGRSLGQIRVEHLDYISENLSQLFFKGLAGSGERDLSIEDFKRSLVPVKSKSKELLLKFSEQETKLSNLKIGSSRIGSWIDLFSGKIYDSEQELLSAKANLSPFPLKTEREFPLAATIKIYKLAGYFLGKQNYKIHNKLIRMLKI